MNSERRKGGGISGISTRYIAGNMRDPPHALLLLCLLLDICTCSFLGAKLVSSLSINHTCPDQLFYECIVFFLERFFCLKFCMHALELHVISSSNNRTK